MQLQEEFSRLIYLYQASPDGKAGTLEETFQKSLAFLEHAKRVIQEGTLEEKRAALQMMQELAAYAQEYIKTMSAKTGQTEQQMQERAAEKAHYSSEEWRAMQEAKWHLAQLGREFVLLARDVGPVLPPPPTPAHPPSKKSRPAKQSKKTDWKRS